MRIVSITSPLLTLALLLQAPFAFAQDDTTDASADEELSAEEQAALEEEEKAAAEAEQAEIEKAEAEATAQAEAEAAAAAEAEAAEVGADETEGLWEPGQEPNRAAPAGKGVVWGRIVDSKNGEPAIEAQVKVLGTKLETFTDYDGYYRLELPPGKYKVQYFYELHEPETLDGVVSTLGQVSRTDAKLTPQAGAIEEVLIQDEAETQTVEGLTLARQRSVSAGDAIGREEISRGTDTNAARAAQRVVGANIVGGRFVYVRGLGERYSNSLLSMYPLPSPEPDRAAVPLDVFPAAVLDSLTIAKTFTPDMPGDFAGGSVQIETRSVPDKPLFNFSLQGGINSQATFQDRLDYAGSGTDSLGFDSGMRSLPSEIPSDAIASGSTFPPGTRPVDINDMGRALNSSMTPRMTSTMPNHGFSAVGGNTWTLANGQKLGVLASLNYTHKYERYQDMILREFRPNATDDRGFDNRLDYRIERGVEKIVWGAFSKVSYLPSKDHKISVSGLHSQLADDTTSFFQGTNADAQARFSASQLDWVQRSLTFGVVSGRHDFHELNDAEFAWDLAMATARRYQPDRRDTVYQYNGRVRDPENPGQAATGWTYVPQSESGRHFFANQTEDSAGGKFDWRQPFLQGTTDLALKVGGLINVKQRAFSARRFSYNATAATGVRDPMYTCIGEQYDLNCPSNLFTDENVGTYLSLIEGSRDGDAYAATLNVYAAYGMLDLDLSDRLRIAGGARVEWTEQRIDPLTPFGEAAPNIRGANLTAADVLPAISLVYSASKETKTRLAFGQTLARPQVRELAPFAFSDYFGGRIVTGNPDLELTRISNFDVRFEYFPSLSEVLAVTTFFKHLDKPIEQVLIPTDGAPQVTYANAKAANLIGVELEGRKNLGFLTAVLNDFSLQSNFTLSYSRTEVQQTGELTITNPSRALINQAPWVFNVAIDYQNEGGTSARLAYNITGPTLIEVGTEGLPDAYQHPFNSLDFSVGQRFYEHWTARLNVINIVNDDFVVTQGPTLNYDDERGNVLRRFTSGTEAYVTLGYEL